MRSKTIRLFISSTFNDFKLERDALQDRVFPELLKLCAGHGFGFMPIDLRWGVSNEAQIDQRTMDLCLNEVKACKSEPHPDFVLLLGDRYGWVPLPYRIQQSEFESLYKYVSQDDKTLLNRWYKLDLNEILPSYILQKREGELVVYKNWEAVENSLRTILQNAVSQTDLEATTKEKYFTSATEFEFDDYLQGFIQNQSNSFLLVDRRINAKNIQSSDFFDNSPKLSDFREKVTKQVDAQNHIKLDTHLLDAKNISDEHIDAFASSLLEKLTLSITKEIQRVQGQEELNEIEYQAFHKNNTAHNIIAREDEITDIVNYTNSSSRQPYFLHGPSGMGKSSVMANAILQSEEALGANVVYRFCGVTKESSSTTSLLRSIFKQLNIHVSLQSMDEEKVEFLEILNLNEEKDTQEKFENEVNYALCGISKKTIIYIDALDQLEDKNKCLWLPSILPENLKIIISLLDDANYEEDSYYFQTLQNLFAKESFHRLEPLSGLDAPKEILRNILKEHNRTLQESQLQSVMELYKDVASPLYLHIIAQELRYYPHTQQTITLATTQKESIKEFIRNLTEYYHHSKLLVEKVFGYIFASQNSLSEATLYEILSNDSELVESVENKFHTNISKKLPTAVWARLHYQISPFLKEDEKGNLHFFHREFSDGAKALYSTELSQKLLHILQNMLDATSKEKEKKELTEIYIKTLANQRYQDPESSIEKQVEYIRHKDEEWVKELLLKILRQGLFYAKETQDLWAIAYQTTALDATKELYKDNPARWAEAAYTTSLSNLATSYYNQNRLDEAIELQEEALSITKELYQENPAEWAEDYTLFINGLTISYYKQSRLDKAIELQEEALSITKELYKENPARWAKIYTTSLNNLAVSYTYQNRLDEAIKLNEEALAIRKELYKENHARWAEAYITSLYNLATSYYNQDRLAEAIELQEEALPITKELYKENPARWAEYYTTPLNNLAASYDKQNRLDEAIKLNEEALPITKELYKENPARWAEAYITSLYNLATSYYNQDRLAEAIELQEEALSITKELYKENPARWAEYYISLLNNLASFYKDQNRLDEAIELEEEVLSITRTRYQHNHAKWSENYITSLNNLASFYKDQNRLDEAIELEEEALPITKELYKENPARWAEAYITSLYNLATSYYNQDRLAEAIELQEEALSITKELYKENHARWAEACIASFNNLITSYKNQNRLDEAIELEEEALSITKVIYQENPAEWAEYYTAFLSNLATFYKKQNKLDRAIELQEEALAIRKELYKENHARWAEKYTASINNLATSYYKQNRLDEAIELQEEALSITKELYQENPARWEELYITSLNNLATSYKNQNRLDEARELEDEQLSIIKALCKENPDRWAKAYIHFLNNLATLKAKNGNYLDASRLFSEYFHVVDFNQYDIRYFIYPFIKWYQCEERLHNEKELARLVMIAQKLKTLYKEKLQEEYKEVIEKEHEGFKNFADASSDLFDKERYDIFIKIFYRELFK